MDIGFKKKKQLRTGEYRYLPRKVVNMKQHPLKFAFGYVPVLLVLASCTVANPRKYLDGAVDDGPVVSRCTANQALRCDGTNLVSCNADGTGEVSESCALGCNSTERRCANLAPSNALALMLDQANGQPDFDLGDSATINTDSGDVIVDGKAIAVKSEAMAQSGAPTIRVFVVRSLTAKNVAVSGTNAFAVVTSGDINIAGTFQASAQEIAPGAGAFNDGSCKGQDGINNDSGNAHGGAGGGGFGSPGGSGNSANSEGRGFARGANGGTTTGNASLVPLRGGCDGGGRRGNVSGSGGGGGGAIQLVSQTKIVVSQGGKVAANGGPGISGGSGGGILFEAPTVDVAGSVVANGAGGSGCGKGEAGRLDAMPASGTAGCTAFIAVFGNGGNGAAGSIDATAGTAEFISNYAAIGGSGGGGFGRIRINTAPGVRPSSGLFSPTPSQGVLGTR